MDLTQRLAISYYKTIATINEAHKVYLVQHQETGKIFIKKILDVYNLSVYKKLAANPVPGTPTIIELCQQDEQLIVIEEYISGPSLQERIDSKSLSFQDVIKYSLDLCKIIERLHAFDPPIIHRDIKPSNIMITSYEKAVLLDFNAAKSYHSDSEEDTRLLGTQGYAAPEQFGFGASSPQTDIYSLGIVMKEMLSVCPDHPKILDRIVKKCTQMNPQQRYANISELINDLPRENTLGSQFSAGNYRRFLPPGFRTFTPWKMFLAIVYYTLLLWICLTMKIQNVSNVHLWIQRFTGIFLFLAPVLGTCNYLNIQRLVPLCEHQNTLVRLLGIVLLDLGLFAFVVFIFAVIEFTFFI